MRRAETKATSTCADASSVSSAAPAYKLVCKDYYQLSASWVRARGTIGPLFTFFFFFIEKRHPASTFFSVLCDISDARSLSPCCSYGLFVSVILAGAQAGSIAPQVRGQRRQALRRKALFLRDQTTERRAASDHCALPGQERLPMPLRAAGRVRCAHVQAPP
ncbi:hypothetical protein TW95_gp0068 [Pandoravirus inopinatum]|uniref:Uncharacterized protein n=1 Tax=Pandoravirus inopinatum TaxID=1605721 RepID=A0A0B5JB77_9VIRU|nr:hypothetical protein TW95_gp0068 [Pandoravirus inopinatum]AJF96802.1 hypothetical protein [Pandoravirus inopinatum]